MRSFFFKFPWRTLGIFTSIGLSDIVLACEILFLACDFHILLMAGS